MKRRAFLRMAGGLAGTGMLGVAPELASEAVAAAAPVGAMPKRTLGRVGWEVSVVGFSGFGLTHEDQEACNAHVRRAFERGVNFYDVAPAYGKGSCETKLGEALRGLDRSRYYLACKTKERNRDGCRRELEASLKSLQTDYFDLYQLHHLSRMEDVEAAMGPGGALEEIARAREAGQVRAIGFSAHTEEAALAAMRQFAFDTVMFPINYVEYYLWDFGVPILAQARESGAAVLSIKTMSAGAWPQGAARTRKWWYRSLEEQDDIDLAYRWTLSLPGVAMGFPPAWMDLQDRAIQAGLAYRPATEADAARLRALAEGCGSIFRREAGRASIRHSRPSDPHAGCDSAWA